MSKTWCVWMKMPAPTGKASQDGWSMIATGLHQSVAELLASRMLFEARAMPDAERPTKS